MIMGGTDAYVVIREKTSHVLDLNIYIYENRDDKLEEKFCECELCNLECVGKIPCMREGGAFMSPEEISITVEHPYTRYGYETHKHLLPTELNLPPYSYPARPYRWTMKRRWLYTGGYAYIEDLAAEMGIDYHSEYEPDMSNKTWVQDGRNQKAIFDVFFEDIEPDNSLCVFYAKQVPFIEDNRRIEAIIDEDMWEGAQAKNKRVATRLRKKHSLDHEHLLSGLIKCPVCGGTITGTTAKRKNKKTGEYTYDYYYRCHNRKRLEDGRYCDFKTSYREELFDKEVFDVIKSFVSSEGCHNEIMKHLDDNVDVSELEVERTQLKNQLKQVVGAKDKLQERMDNLSVEDKHYDRKYEDMSICWSNLYNKINNIEENIRVISRRISQVKQKHLSSKEVYKALLNFDVLYSSMTEEERKEFYQDFIEEINVHQDRNRSERMVKSILFKFPLYYNDQVGNEVLLPKDFTVETVCLLSKLHADHHIEV